MNRRDSLLSQEPLIIDFAIECGWLHCYGHRLFDLTWELDFSVWVMTNGEEELTRRNPRRTLQVRLRDEGILTDFVGDEFVQSLVGHVETVDLASMLDTMALIAIANPKYYSEPIVLLDDGTDSQ